MRRLTLLLAAAVVLALAFDAAAASARLTIKFNHQTGVTAMGKFHPRRAPSLRSAIRAFGRPTARRKLGKSVCKVRWSRLSLRITFAYFGLPPRGKTACSPSVGLAQNATIRGKHVGRWGTKRGLHGGSSLDRLLELYPGAEQHGRRWWLAKAISPFGDEEEYALFAVGVTNGYVRDFHIPIGAAGE